MKAMNQEVVKRMMEFSNTELPLPYKDKLINLYALIVTSAYEAGAGKMAGSAWTFASDSPPTDHEPIVMQMTVGTFLLGWCREGVYYDWHTHQVVPAPTQWKYINA